MKPDSPYVGPRTFTGKERSLFFGRDREVEDLIHLLLAERIVLLHSPSGAGKSSLLQAGLIPQLKELGFLTKGPLRVNDCANFPWEENFPKDPHGEVIIFDQFEETITVDPINVDAKKRFFQQLGRALHNKERWAVFAIREDYLAALDPYLNFIPTRLSNTFRLNLLGEKGAKDAICLPAQNAGIPFSKEAADSLFDDLRTIQIELPDGCKESAKGEFVEPVQLQVVCSRIWSDLLEDAREIGFDNIRTKKDDGEKDPAKCQSDSFSEVDRALADFYSETVKNVAKIPEAISKKITERDLRDWFEKHLITRQGIRSQVLRSEGLGEKISQGLIEGYVVRPETRSNRDFLELAHDRLIQPVLASNKEWRDANLSPFQQEAERWNENGERSPDRLLRGQALQQAEAWAKSNVPNATELEFLKASQGARTALAFRRIATAVMGISLVAVGVFAYQFYEEKKIALEQKKKALEMLAAGRETTRGLVFEIGDNGQVPIPVREDLLRMAIRLNDKLGGRDVGGATIGWWAHKLEAQAAESDGKPDEEAIHYEHAKSIADQAAKDHGDDPDAQQLLLLSYKDLGEFKKRLGDVAKGDQEQNAEWLEATGYYQKALPIAQKLANDYPKDPHWLYELYFLHEDLADVIKEPTEARKQYDKALSESTQLAQEDPSDESAQTLQWTTLMDLGDWSKSEGKNDQGAVAFYQRALTVAEKLYQSSPLGSDADSRARHFKYERILWANYMALGDVNQAASGRRAYYEKARTLATELYNKDQAQRQAEAEAQKKTHSSESQAKKDLDQTLKALADLKGNGAK